LSDQVWVAGEVLIDLIPDGSKHVAVVGEVRQIQQKHWPSLE